MGSLQGSVAMITGSGSGIGRATAVLMAERGATVIAHDINAAGLEETVNKIQDQGGAVGGWVADVSAVESMERVVSEAIQKFGKIDILVNNAGTPGDRRPIEDITLESYERSLGVHVKGTIFTTQAVIGGMKERRSGRIVNLSSINALSGVANSTTYNAAKGALLALTKGWAQEFAPWNILVNAVAPGWCVTPMPLSRDSPERLAEIAGRIPLRRMSEPEEQAAAICFLCSPEAAYITGQVLSPNGGLVI